MRLHLNDHSVHIRQVNSILNIDFPGLFVERAWIHITTLAAHSQSIQVRCIYRLSVFYSAEPWTTSGRPPLGNYLFAEGEFAVRPSRVNGPVQNFDTTAAHFSFYPDGALQAINYHPLFEWDVFHPRSMWRQRALVFHSTPS